MIFKTRSMVFRGEHWTLLPLTRDLNRFTGFELDSSYSCIAGIASTPNNWHLCQGHTCVGSALCPYIDPYFNFIKKCLGSPLNASSGFLTAALCLGSRCHKISVDRDIILAP